MSGCHQHVSVSPRPISLDEDRLGPRNNVRSEFDGEPSDNLFLEVSKRVGSVAVRLLERGLLDLIQCAKVTRRVAMRALLVQSFGLATILNRGAGGELLIRQSSISMAKNENGSIVLALSQSTTARWSGWMVSAIHTTVFASSMPAR
jgi:hypothetical protein